MKKVSLLLFVTLGLGLATMSSCKKEEETPEPTKKELLTTGTWTGITSDLFEDDQLTDTEDISDDQFKFNTDGTGTHYYMGAVDETFTWSFNGDETYLIMDTGNGDVWNAKIETLSSSKLTISETDTWNGIEYKYVIYMGK